MPYRTPLDANEHRYLNDPTFHAMVDMMTAVIENLQLTPSEVREAAMYACVRLEERRVPAANHASGENSFERAYHVARAARNPADRPKPTRSAGPHRDWCTAEDCLGQCMVR